MVGGGAAPGAWHDLAMSLATRCTSCATTFRVVQDQLKVSEGWVRCGRCDAVFNALEGLFDLGATRPPTGTTRSFRCSLRARPNRWCWPPPTRRRRRADERRRRSGVEPGRAARRSDRCATVRPAQAGRGRAQAGRPARPTRPGRVLRCPLRFRSLLREPVAARDRADRPAGDRPGRAAARKLGATRVRSPCRPPCALAERAGTRSAGHGRRGRAGGSRAAGRTSLPRHARSAVAGDARTAPGLVPLRRLQARAAATDRRHAGREHGADARSRDRTDSCSRSRCATAAR